MTQHNGLRDDFYSRRELLVYTGDLKEQATIIFRMLGAQSNLETVDETELVVTFVTHAVPDTRTRGSRELVREPFVHDLNVMDKCRART